MNYRVIYAKNFNTLEERVFYWHELSETQQNATRRQFSDMFPASNYVYETGKNGSIISRRRLHFRDAHQPTPAPEA